MKRTLGDSYETDPRQLRSPLEPCALALAPRVVRPCSTLNDLNFESPPGPAADGETATPSLGGSNRTSREQAHDLVIEAAWQAYEDEKSAPLHPTTTEVEAIATLDEAAIAAMGGTPADFYVYHELTDKAVLVRWHLGFFWVALLDYARAQPEWLNNRSNWGTGCKNKLRKMLGVGAEVVQLNHPDCGNQKPDWIKLSVAFCLDLSDPKHWIISLQFPSRTQPPTAEGEEKKSQQKPQQKPQQKLQRKPQQKRQRASSSKRRVRQKKVNKEETQTQEVEQQVERRGESYPMMSLDSSDLMASLPGSLPLQGPAGDLFTDDIASNYSPIFDSDEEIAAFGAQFAEDLVPGDVPIGQNTEDDVLNKCLEWVGESLGGDFMRFTPDWSPFWLNDCPPSRHPKEFGSQWLTSPDPVIAAHCGCFRPGGLVRSVDVWTACSAGYNCYYGHP